MSKGKKFILNSFENVKSVILKDKREICLKDEKEFSLLIISSNGETLLNLPIQYPSFGYGGGSLFLSLSESYLVFAYYSGQGDESFMLFEIRDGLEEIYGEDYFIGFLGDYCFSRNEKLLIQSLSFFFWEDLDDEEIFKEIIEKDENGKLFFDFASINVLDIAKKVVNEHLIRVYFSDNWQFKKDNRDEPFMLPQMINGSMLKISMPWGDELLNLPLNETIIFSL